MIILRDVSVFAHVCNDESDALVYRPMNDSCSYNKCMSHKFMFCVSLLLAVAHDHIFATTFAWTSITHFCFCEVLCLYDTLYEFFQLHVSAGSIVNAVQPTKEVCLNLEFFPLQFPFESGWKELK